MMFFGLVGSIVFQGHAIVVGDETSLLHKVLSGDEVSEGPLSPSAYAQGNAPSIGGSRFASVDASDANFITFDDPEVKFAQTLEGNAVVAPMQPTDTEDIQNGTEAASFEKLSTSAKPFIHTVEDGDTIAGIAAKYDVSANTILWANSLRATDIIKFGDHLTILPTTGVLHVVVSGDTVLSLADKYNAKGDEIIAYNNLGEDAKLFIRQKIIIPDGYQTLRQAPRIVSNTTQTDRDAGDEPTPAPKKDDAPSSKRFIWPTITKHLSQYFKWGHTGIDIDNRSAPPIFAAQDGTVEFNGWLGGYGNLIIVNHGGGLTTYYAHLSKFYVAKGDRVKKGDAIAKMGSTGRSTGPHLHFEVRRNGQPVNPLGMY